MIEEVDVSEIWDELKLLDVRERLVIVLRYGMIGPKGSSLTLSEVGEILNVTRERVRYIEAHALHRLMRRFGLLKDEHLYTYYKDKEYNKQSLWYYDKEKLLKYQRMLKYQSNFCFEPYKNYMVQKRNRMKCDFIDVFSGGFVFHFDPVKFTIDRSYTGLCGDGMRVVFGEKTKWVYSDLKSTPELNR